MFCPKSHKDELEECYETQVGHAKKMNPRLAAKLSTRGQSQKGPANSIQALVRQKTMMKVKKKLDSKLMLQMGVSETANDDPNNVDTSKHQSHLLHHFQEIGWVDPIRDGTKTACAEEKNLISGDFNVLAYDESKYVEDWPPFIIYVPSIPMFKKMLKTCVKGVNGQPVRELEDMMGHYTDLEWFE